MGINSNDQNNFLVWSIYITSVMIRRTFVLRSVGCNVSSLHHCTEQMLRFVISQVWQYHHERMFFIFRIDRYGTPDGRHPSIPPKRCRFVALHFPSPIPFWMVSICTRCVALCFLSESIFDPYPFYSFSWIKSINDIMMMMMVMMMVIIMVITSDGHYRRRWDDEYHTE